MNGHRRSLNRRSPPKVTVVCQQHTCRRCPDGSPTSIMNARCAASVSPTQAHLSGSWPFAHVAQRAWRATRACGQHCPRGSPVPTRLALALTGQPTGRSAVRNSKFPPRRRRAGVHGAARYGKGSADTEAPPHHTNSRDCRPADGVSLPEPLNSPQRSEIFRAPPRTEATESLFLLRKSLKGPRVRKARTVLGT